jgi:hypothetical protein
MESLSIDPLMRRWWEHMADVMDTNPESGFNFAGAVFQSVNVLGGQHLGQAPVKQVDRFIHNRF